MKIHDVFLVVTIALNGCNSFNATPDVNADGVMRDAISVCELAERGLIEGVVTRIFATYETDKSHYAYLLSRGCGKNGVLNVGDMEPVSKKSVENFYKAIDQRCVEKGTSYICLITAKIEADIEVIRDQDGEFAAKLLKVHEFSFMEIDR